MNEHNEQQWPEYLMLRDTGLYDDAGGLGQQIFTTAGAGYVKQKYVRADLAAQPSPVVKQNLTTAAAQEAAGVDAYDDALDQLWKLAGGNDHPVYKRFLDFRDSFATPVTAAPAEFDRARETPRRQRAVELLLSMGYQWRDDKWVAPGTPAAPGIDLSTHHVAVLRDMREHMANRTMSLNDWDKLGTDALDAVLALIDASPKGALPTLPDDFSESKDWRAGNYGERVEWLMDTVRSQREHIDSLLDSPKGGSEARARFEAWAESENMRTSTLIEGGEYVGSDTRFAWNVWQAAVQATNRGVGVGS